MARTSLNLWDYSDVELLHLLKDYEGDQGWTDSHDLVEPLGFSTNGNGNGKHYLNPRQAIGSRLSWLRRYGVLERHPDQTNLWRPTPQGTAVRDAHLHRRQEDSLAKLDYPEAIAVVRLMTTSFTSMPGATQNVMRREFKRNTGRTPIRLVKTRK